MEIVNDHNLINKYRSLCQNQGFPVHFLQDAQLQLYEAGENIIKADEVLNEFYIFLKGTCKIYKYLENGIEAIIHINQDFQIYGEVELFENSLSHTHIQCLTASYCFVIPYTDTLKNDTDFLKFCLLRLSHKMNTYDQNHLLNNHYSVEEKLAAYILCCQKNNVFSIDYKHLANYLGCSYRHLLRILNVLCQKAVLERKKGYYKIIDFEKLQMLAYDSYLL